MAPRNGNQTPLRRAEDERVLYGGGNFLDDIHRAGELHCSFVRSSVGRARVTEIHTGAQESSVYTYPNLASTGVGHELLLPIMYSFPQQVSTRIPVLVDREVLYFGQPIAVALGNSRAEAEDAAEEVDVTLEPLPAQTAVPPPRQVFTDSPPKVDADGAVQALLSSGQGDFVEDGYDVVAEVDIHLGRAAPMPIETRGTLASYDPVHNELTVWTNTQMPHAARRWIAEALGFNEADVIVIVPDVGGAFGGKWHLYPEDLVVAALARQIGRPVRWIEDRAEHFAAAVHAREQTTWLTLGADVEGSVGGVRVRAVVDQGAHFHTCGPGPARNVVYLAAGAYKVPCIDAAVASALTNKTPYGAYRGFGQEAAFYAIERGMDLLARRTGADRLELRLRNLPDVTEMPYKTPTGQVFDSGDFRKALTLAADHIGYREPRPALHGIGLSFYVERTGLGSSKAIAAAGWQESTVDTEMVALEPGGRITVRSGLVQMGQGVETALQKVTASVLGVERSQVKLLLANTREAPYSGFGTAGSRGVVSGMSALRQAATILRQQILTVASQILGEPVGELVLADGKVTVADRASTSMTLADVAHAFYVQRSDSFKGVDLQATASFDIQAAAFSYGAHAAAVRLDPDTGIVTIDRYVVVHDCGPVIDQGLVEGQLRGGIAQGIGQALYESLDYDDDATLRVQTLSDYRMPTALDCPSVEFVHLETASLLTEGGWKGVGESGCIGAPPTIASAVQDALGPQAPFITDLPIHPDTIKQCMQSAAKGK